MNDAIDLEEKRAFFVGGVADGSVVVSDEIGLKYVDVPRRAAIILRSAEINSPKELEYERYFLYPKLITVQGKAYALYMVQDWNMEMVAEHLLQMVIQVIDTPPPELKLCSDSLKM